MVSGFLLLALLGTAAGLAAEAEAPPSADPDHIEETTSIPDLDFLQEQWQKAESLALTNDEHIQATALSVLAFINYGFDQKTNTPFQKTVEEMLNALQAQQTDSGQIGEEMLSHILATLALSEAMALTRDPHLHEPCQSALSHLLQISHQGMIGTNHGRWWAQVDTPRQRGDTRLTFWAAMACQAFIASGIKLNEGDPLPEIRHWAQQAQQAGAHTEEDFFPAWFNGIDNEASSDHATIHDSALLLLLGEPRPNSARILDSFVSDRDQQKMFSSDAEMDFLRYWVYSQHARHDLRDHYGLFREQLYAASDPATGGWHHEEDPRWPHPWMHSAWRSLSQTFGRSWTWRNLPSIKPAD